MLRYSPVADDLAERFAAAGHRLYLVGGSVRDALLGRLSPDLDFTTDARPEQIQALVSGWAEAVWDTGIAFGTVGAVRRGVTCEITTFRADAYDGVSRNPVVAFGDSVEGDLVRRDFTANAMALSLPDRTFVDPLRRARRPGPRRPRHPDRPGDVVRRRPAAPAARRPASSPSSGSRSRRGCAWRWRRWRPSSDGSPRSGCRRSSRSCCSARTPGAGSSSWSTPGSPTSCCPRCRRCAWRSTSTPSTRTSTSTR